MSHKKAAGSTQNIRDSKPKYLGVKIYGGQSVKAGNIIVRQRGTKYRTGENTDLGKDHTIFATENGVVKFSQKGVTKYDGRKFKVTMVHVKAA